MRNNKQLILKFTIFCFCSIGILYAVYLFILPPVLSSKLFVNKINSVISHTTGIKVHADKFSFVSYPSLVFDLKFDKLQIYIQETELLNAKDGYLKFDIKNLSLNKINIDYVFINENGLKRIFNKKSAKKSFNFNLKKIPETSIKNAEIWIDKDGINSIFITVSNLKLIQNGENSFCVFEAEIISDLFRNLINVGKKGYLYFQKDSLYAKDLQILIGVSMLNLNGKIIDSNDNNDFSIKGENIPIADIKASLLYFQKLKDSSKKFIENFYDFSGNMDVDVHVKEKGIYGKCIAKKLAAKTVLFDVPIFFKKVDLIFDKDTLQASETGTLGGEKVYTSFKLSNIAKKNQEVVGNVYANLTNKSVSKYVPFLSLQGYATTSVDYCVKNKKINVNYL